MSTNVSSSKYESKLNDSTSIEGCDTNVVVESSNFSINPVGSSECEEDSETSSTPLHVKNNNVSPDSIPLFPHPLLKQKQQQLNQINTSTTLLYTKQVSDTMNHIVAAATTTATPNNTYVYYPEDEEGEPVVDDDVLQTLIEQQSRRVHDDMMIDDDELHDDDEPVMLEGGDKTTLEIDENDEIDDDEGGDRMTNYESLELRQSLVMKHGRHPSTIIEEQIVDPIHHYHQQQQEQEQQPQQSSFMKPQQYNINDNNMHRRVAQPSSPTSPSYSLRRTSSSRQNLLQPELCNNEENHFVTKGLGLGVPSIPLIKDPLLFLPHYTSTRYIQQLSRIVVPSQHVNQAGAATWIGFWALLHVTCANYMLTPMRDAIALHVGVQHIPKLTLASTLLAVFSSVPIGWLFEAPDPCRRRLWKRMGLTRGETQGTSLALFYRVFALSLIAYAVGFQFLESIRNHQTSTNDETNNTTIFPMNDYYIGFLNVTKIWTNFAPAMFIAFFLLVHLMKLHCLSLVWGVTTEAMEYEEVARTQYQQQLPSGSFAKVPMESQKMRLKRLSLVGFGGTVGGILGSMIASTTAQLLKLPGLLLLAAFMLEISAELSIELGRIMKKHWEGQQQLFQSSNDLASLDHSMLRSSSLGSMKRISSGNSLNRVRSTSDLGNNNKTLSPAASFGTPSRSRSNSITPSATDHDKLNDDSFSQRMARGITTILKSRLLMAIFTYNALYASTTVLLSFQRAELIANRNKNTTVQADTAFLANINMASSAAIFALQASGVGAYVAHSCGPRTTLALMPLIRLIGVVALAWWHRTSGGQAPNLIIFLIVDECCKIMNLAVAKPVRESLWRGLSNEARYEAKPIVDTLANRWGGGSAAFLVSFVDKTLDLFGGTITGPEERELGIARTVFGFPPVLFLCVIITTWWAAVSADLGQIRKNIDIELKKRQ